MAIKEVAVSYRLLPKRELKTDTASARGDDYMKVLDLFSGLGGFSQVFVKRGHKVVTVDIEPKFNPDILVDIMNMNPSWFSVMEFDIILASPPCNCFSVASIYRHWDKERKMPTDTKTNDRIRLVTKTIELIHEWKPRWWVIENPRGMLRKIIGMPHYEITQCQYGRPYMKPTDLWGRLPKSFKAKRCKAGSDCHERATRSSKDGVQGIISSLDRGMTKAERAKIPYGLSEAICLACEKEMI